MRYYITNTSASLPSVVTDTKLYDSPVTRKRRTVYGEIETSRKLTTQERIDSEVIYADYYLLTKSQAQHITGAHIPLISELQGMTADELKENTYSQTNKNAWWVRYDDSTKLCFVGNDGVIYDTEDASDQRINMRLMLDIDAQAMHLEVGDDFYFWGIVDGDVLYTKEGRDYVELSDNFWDELKDDDWWRNRKMKFRVISNSLAFMTSRYNWTDSSSSSYLTVKKGSHTGTAFNNALSTNPYNYATSQIKSQTDTIIGAIKSQYGSSPFDESPLFGYFIPLQYNYYFDIIKPDLNNYSRVKNMVFVLDGTEGTITINGETKEKWVVMLEDILDYYVNHPAVPLYGDHEIRPSRYNNSYGGSHSCYDLEWYYGSATWQLIWRESASGWTGNNEYRDGRQDPITGEYILNDYVDFRGIRIYISKADGTIEQLKITSSVQPVLKGEYYWSTGGYDSDNNYYAPICSENYDISNNSYVDNGQIIHVYGADWLAYRWGGKWASHYRVYENMGYTASITGAGYYKDLTNIGTITH